jgi:hypothetical protein
MERMVADLVAGTHRENNVPCGLKGADVDFVVAE